MTNHDTASPGTAAAAKAPEPPAYLPGVDGLRGLAALSIVLYHIFTNAHMPELRLWHHINVLRPLHDGWAAVNLFLVLSGFCLFWPYARRRDRACRYLDFMQNRSRRILPAYYASLAIVPAAFYVMVKFGIPAKENFLPHNWWDALLHLLMLHSLTPSTLRTWSGVGWSLGLEWTWYLSFPLVVWLFRRAGAGRGLVIVAAITFAYRFGLYFVLGPAIHFSNDTFTMWLRVLLPGRLLEFGLGMYVASLLADAYRSGRPREASFFRFATAAFALSLILLAAGHACIGTDVFLPFTDAFFGLASAFLLVAAVDPSRGFVQRAFSGRLLDGIGQCSYSLFLFHLPITYVICELFRLHGIAGSRNFFCSLITLVPAILVARLGYRFIEAPFLRRARLERAPSTGEEGRSAFQSGNGPAIGASAIEL